MKNSYKLRRLFKSFKKPHTDESFLLLLYTSISSRTIQRLWLLCIPSWFLSLCLFLYPAMRTHYYVSPSTFRSLPLIVLPPDLKWMPEPEWISLELDRMGQGRLYYRYFLLYDLIWMCPVRMLTLSLTMLYVHRKAMDARYRLGVFKDATDQHVPYVWWFVCCLAFVLDQVENVVAFETMYYYPIQYDGLKQVWSYATPLKWLCYALIVLNIAGRLLQLFLLNWNVRKCKS